MTASRAAALAGRRFGVPVFTFIDYEYVDLNVPRRTGSYVALPRRDRRRGFRAKGFARDRLIAFAGLKEGISFADVDLASVVPFDFGAARERRSRVCSSGPLRNGRTTTTTSRATWPVRCSNGSRRATTSRSWLTPRMRTRPPTSTRFDWRSAPIVLDDARPFVSLLAAVDAVMSSGGTMLREAAYLGIPAYSIFRSEIGAVDRLEALAASLRRERRELDSIISRRRRAPHQRSRRARVRRPARRAR